MRKILFCILFCLTGLQGLRAEEGISLIPQPAQLTAQTGTFRLTARTQLLNEAPEFTAEAARWQHFVKARTGHYLPATPGENRIRLTQATGGLPAEGYRLTVTPQEVTLAASSPAGAFYGLQTLEQLAQNSQGEAGIALPCLTIEDYPAYAWRGMMLDVSRHFYTLEYLKQQIDLLAYYKMNKLHLHLTDDQGWRMEIKKHPELTQRSALRTFNSQDSTCIRLSATEPDRTPDPRFVFRHGDTTLYGGYYTQAELKELVRYAAERHVEVIPEIDMPGHMLAAISAYPELSCTGKAVWGKTFSVPLCPANEAVYAFLQDVLDEVLEVFPSRYVHIGADEVEKDTWEQSAACRELMAREGLGSVKELQSYFVERMQKYLEGKGKKVIGWDDALEGGINKDLTIMYWRDWVADVPAKALGNGNDLIFTPGFPLYFSREDSCVYDVYHLKGLNRDLPEAQKRQVLGAQANLWAESIPSENQANKLLYPRLLALAEVVWSPEEARNWTSFKQRLSAQTAHLDRLGVKHTPLPHTLIPDFEVNLQEKQIRLTLESEKTAPAIYYTLDGSDPTPRSLRYDGPITIGRRADVVAGMYAGGEMKRPFFRRSLDYHKAVGTAVSYANPWNASYPAAREATLTDGLRGGDRYGDGFWQGFTDDMEVTVDLGAAQTLRSVALTFMQQTGPGVYMPQYVEVSLSEDGQTWRKAQRVPNDVDEAEKKLVLKTFKAAFKKQKARYVKVVAKKGGPNRFMFTDEIVIY